MDLLLKEEKQLVFFNNIMHWLRICHDYIFKKIIIHVEHYSNYSLYHYDNGSCYQHFHEDNKGWWLW
jgi:hypothetical protein